MKTDASVQARGASVLAKLDHALGLTSMSGLCPLCGSPRIDLETDTLGRSVDRCLACDASWLTAPPSVRPDGDGYSMQAHRGPRRPPRQLPDSTDPAVLLLRATRAARTAAGPSPALLDAKRMYDENQLALKAARKGGRPRKEISVGRPQARRIVILDEPIAESPPPLPPAAAAPSPLPPPPALLMPKTFAPRVCSLPSCQRDFTPAGSTQRYCSVEHREEHKKVSAAPSKAAKGGRPRKAIKTGFTPAHAAKSGGGYSDAIEALETKIADLDAERKRLVDTRDHLRALEAAAE